MTIQEIVFLLFSIDIENLFKKKEQQKPKYTGCTIQFCNLNWSQWWLFLGKLVTDSTNYSITFGGVHTKT